LARVSSEWYTRLEQGRNARASEDALRRIARALRLTPAEHDHLLRLSGYATNNDLHNRAALEQQLVTSELQRLIDLQLPRPAYILGARWDLLAWNHSAKLLWGNIGELRGLQRNTLYQLFLGDRYPSILKNLEYHRRRCIALLRARSAEHLGTPWFQELIAELQKNSPVFCELWKTQEVNTYQDGRKEYQLSPDINLQFDFLSLQLDEQNRDGIRLIIFLPVPGTTTEIHLSSLVGCT
ncbi:MAG: helix-turn-helix transcriptional regulator, partial [Candidatus Sumerlaeia bacterium]|nr:helix-turn-helix transcriptional regulator [Candidatus Sumerlaeia bacterium]